MEQTVLVIDDDPLFRVMIDQLLSREGYRVNLASDGQEGLELFSDNGADLIITDILMPVKEGLETIREIKAISPETPVIAISGGGSSSSATLKTNLQMAKAFRAEQVFTKPLDIPRLMQTVRQLTRPPKKKLQ